MGLLMGQTTASDVLYSRLRRDQGDVLIYPRTMVRRQR
jgi:hypothetical protein